MKAVESFACTGVLPTARAHSVTVFTLASSVRIVRTTSTSFMSGTGLKKCTPSTCPGRLVAAAIAVTLHDDVLEARIACGGQIRSSLAKVSFLSAWFSVIASTTRSAVLRSSSRVVRAGIAHGNRQVAVADTAVLLHLAEPAAHRGGAFGAQRLLIGGVTALCARRREVEEHRRADRRLQLLGGGAAGGEGAQQRGGEHGDPGHAFIHTRSASAAGSPSISRGPSGRPARS